MNALNLWGPPNPDTVYNLPAPIETTGSPGLDSEIAQLTPSEAKDAFNYFGLLDSYSAVARTSLRNMCLLRSVSAMADGDSQRVQEYLALADAMTKVLPYVELTFRDLTAIERQAH